VSEHLIEVIPVIDLKGGTVVHARQGLRHSYAPLVTPLARTSTPHDVVTGLLAIYPFPVVYIADLDRIELRGSNEQFLDALTAAFSGVTFWVDAGVRDAEDARSWLARHKRGHLVLGSESLGTHAALEDLAGIHRIILSLDYRGESFLGPHALCDRPGLWPKRVIAMSLDRVGSNAGPDIARLANIKCRAPDVMLYAAGGLRDSSDLVQLKQAGITGVLVASALHDGRLTCAGLSAAVPKGSEAKK
jgi:phosphoribosylformimino-5-aminoimidazole carboxamide ribotide isomerase